MLSAAVVTVLLCTACGGNDKAPSSPSSQGFIPAPAPNSTAAVAASSVSATVTASTSPVQTTIASATAIATSSPTPVGTPDVQATAQANGCNVTPFASSGPPQIHFELYPRWYGQGDLWLAPTSIYAGMGFQQKNATVWFQGITPIVIMSNGDPTISAHVQGDAGTTATTSRSSPQPNYPLHGIDVDLSQAGCWQLSVRSGAETLDITLWAVPITQRPDVANLQKVRSQLTPYPPPSSCQTTDWNGPDDHRAPFAADYWITGQGITLDVGLPIFFATRSGYFDVYHDFPDPPGLSGQIAGNAAGVVRSSWIIRSTENSANGWRGEVTFSSPGCWQLEVTDGAAKVDFRLYVYPADCFHALDEPAAPTCKPPA